MKIDVSELLALPAAERLELAELLRHSVGHPVDPDLPVLPPWQLARMVAVLARFGD